MENWRELVKKESLTDNDRQLGVGALAVSAGGGNNRILVCVTLSSCCRAAASG
jgi:hypothetical protein